MFRKLGIAALAIATMAGAAFADPIEGNWRTDSGQTAAITGGGTFTITVKTGEHAGKRIGTMKADGKGGYVGEIMDPAKDKWYAGSATLSGGSLKMKGCLKTFNWPCRTQNWKKL